MKANAYVKAPLCIYVHEVRHIARLGLVGWRSGSACSWLTEDMHIVEEQQ